MDPIVEAARQWQETGWVVADGVLPRDLVDRSVDELKASGRQEFGGPTRRAELATRAAKRYSGDDAGPSFRIAQFDGVTLFPIPDCPTLNRLFVHPELVRFAQEALGTNDIRIYQSRVWSKQGDHTNYEQPMHSDGNHALIPIVNRPGWWHLECFVYLTDVDETNGAPCVVPGDIARAQLTERRSLTPDEAPDLYANEVRATGSAGSILGYRSDVWHRGASLDPGTERHVLVVSFRPATAPWVGFDAHAPLVGHPDFATFAAQCTPEELALFGVPLPGHPYWREPEVLDVMGQMYPGLDLTPWQLAAD